MCHSAMYLHSFDSVVYVLYLFIYLIDSVKNRTEGGNTNVRGFLIV
jgi:hypothetical protein